MQTRSRRHKEGRKTRKKGGPPTKTLSCPTRSSSNKYQIGTSGFMVSQSLWFSFACLNCIEINGTFYRLPTPKSIEKWRNFPDHVSVVIKASKYITHIKRLNDVKKGWNELWHLIEPLGSKLRAVLFQLPPSFTFNEENMARIEKMHTYIPSSLKVVFEFRDISWFKQEVYERFKKMEWCVAGTYIQKKPGTKWMGTMPAGLNLPPKTSNLNYLRVHGARGYKGSLNENQLQEIYAAFKKHKTEESFIMFNNTFFDPRSKYCIIDDSKVKYAAVCNAVEFTHLLPAS